MATSKESATLNVAVAGGSGGIGATVVEALLTSGKFNVTLLSRNELKDVPPEAKVAAVNYADLESLKKALAGQDALVCTLARIAIPYQVALIDAAVEVGVKRIILSEFGANLQNENSRQLTNYRQKVMVEDYLEHQCRQSNLTYTYIYTNVLMDWSIRAGIVLDFKEAKIYLYNGGEDAVSMTTIPGLAQAIVRVLSDAYERTSNRALCVHEALISQKTLLTYAKDATPGLPWIEELVDLVKLESDARSNKPQLANVSTFHAGAMRSAFASGFGNHFGTADSDLLGLERMSASQIKDLLSALAKEIRGSP